MKAREAAEYLSLSQSYLAQLRMTGDGPPFRMFGRAVRYRREDIDAWTDERLRRSTQGGTVAGAR
ncbi:MAG: helix-turn-helix domain-containing protein [Gemmatimonadetes bacterium]|nr:helix-turn-helix domain-containing protein [Gemmatimonadota bacterium]